VRAHTRAGRLGPHAVVTFLVLEQLRNWFTSKATTAAT